MKAKPKGPGLRLSGLPRGGNPKSQNPAGSKNNPEKLPLKAGAGRRVPGIGAPTPPSAPGAFPRRLHGLRGRPTHSPTSLRGRRSSLLSRWLARAPQTSAAAGGARRARRAHPPSCRRRARSQVAAAAAAAATAAATAAAAAAGAHPLSDAPAAPRSRRLSRVPGPSTHARVPHTIAAAFAAALSPSACHEEAGEEGMRLQALPEE